MNTKSSSAKITLELLTDITEINPDAWNQVAGTHYPFIRHEFLATLENSGSVGESTGWHPQHLVAYRDNQLVALMPLYLKTQSYGEYVFDWAWADAYQRNGLQYYPKLLTAIPFTPATGPRLCVADEAMRQELSALTVKFIQSLMEEKNYSSWHLLFPEGNDRNALVGCGLSPRSGCQYHWFNHNYSSFDDFLATFNSRKRKNIKRERRRVAEQGIRLERHTGQDITSAELRIFYTFYQATYYKRARRGYLNQSFFEELLNNMPQSLVLVIAYIDQRAVAAALCIKGQDTLYGRYWGCLEEYECLHFEACYYQGVEYCIEQGIGKFDPGAQGEHKISRGFEPTNTYSLHWIRHPGFRTAIDSFLERESQDIDEYMEQAAELLPFKKQ